MTHATHPATQALLDLLELEAIELGLYRGLTEADAGSRVFGGLVLAQALRASAHTVEDRLPHSLHAYFLRPGDSSIPILYEVENLRDGGSFSSRRVRAIQRGEPIFSMSVSFQASETGFEYAETMADWPGPEALEDDVIVSRRLHGKDPNVMPWHVRERAFEVRSVYPPGAADPNAAIKPAWLRARASTPAHDQVLQRCLLAYASDMGLMASSLVPHRHDFPRQTMMAASLDHALWFHRDVSVDHWFLFDRESPRACDARGFNRATFHSLDGTLMASAAQEALIRPMQGATAAGQ